MPDPAKPFVTIKDTPTGFLRVRMEPSTAATEAAQVKPGEKYVFPKSEVNWKKITEKELATILKKSEKKNLAVSLATEVGLGGLYAEEVCRKNEIDKNKIPQDITEKEAKEIINTSKEFLKWIKEPQGYIYEDEVTPFPLMDQKEMVKTKTYNEAINT